MKKLTQVLLPLLLSICLLAGCQSAPASTQSETPADTQETKTTIRIGALSGPTAMGMVKLMQDTKEQTTVNDYQFADLTTDPSTLVTAFSKGELDICAVPSNLASNLYNKRNGNVVVLAVNVYGVVSIVERSNQLNTLSDLKGKTIYATGQGSVPEYALRYVLEKNGLDADKDITIQWCSDTTEALSYIQNDANAIAMLPQPFVTAALSQVDDLRIAFDLNDEWSKISDNSSIVTGVVITSKDFLNENKAAVDAFLEEYADSVAFTQTNPEEAANLIVDAGIVKAAPLAQKALPYCSLTCLTGKEMKDTLSSFLNVIYNYNDAAVGGSLPEDDFYYEEN